MLTTQFFGMKIQRYMHEHGISSSTLAKVAAKAFRNGSLNENAWRRKPLSEEEMLGGADALAPPHAVHVLLARRGRRGAGALPRRHGLAASPTDPVFLRAAVLRSRPVRHLRGVQPVAGARAWSEPHRRRGERRPSRWPASGPDEMDLVQVQDTESGAEVMHLAECGLCEDGEQEELIQLGETEIGGRLPVNTDGGCLANGEPIGASGLRQVYECVLQLRGQAGARQVPDEPRTAFTHVYGAPGISACTVLST